VPTTAADPTTVVPRRWALARDTAPGPTPGTADPAAADARRSRPDIIRSGPVSATLSALAARTPLRSLRNADGSDPESAGLADLAAGLPLRSRRNVLIGVAATALIAVVTAVAMASGSSGSAPQTLADPATAPDAITIASGSPPPTPTAGGVGVSSSPSGTSSSTSKSPALRSGTGTSPGDPAGSPTGSSGQPPAVPPWSPNLGPGTSAPATSASPTSTAAQPYSDTVSPACRAAAGADYSEAGTYTGAGRTGWFTETRSAAADPCASTARFMPLSGTADDSGAYIQWRFPTAAIQTGSCAVTVLIPPADPQGTGAGLGGGASAHYEILDGSSLAVTSSFDLPQAQFAGRFHPVGSFPLTGGAFILRLVDRGVAQAGLPWPAHFAADKVRVDCVAS
jgi:hypothetical protein